MSNYPVCSTAEEAVRPGLVKGQGICGFLPTPRPSLGDFRAGDHPGDSCGPEGKGYIVDGGWSWKFSRKSRNKELKSWAQPVNVRKRNETRGQFEYD